MTIISNDSDETVLTVYSAAFPFFISCVSKRIKYAFFLTA